MLKAHGLSPARDYSKKRNITEMERAQKKVRLIEGPVVDDAEGIGHESMAHYVKDEEHGGTMIKTEGDFEGQPIRLSEHDDKDYQEVRHFEPIPQGTFNVGYTSMMPPSYTLDGASDFPSPAALRRSNSNAAQRVLPNLFTLPGDDHRESSAHSTPVTPAGAIESFD